MVKAVTLALAAFSNFSLETLVPNLVSLICPSPQILRRNSDGGISDFRISGKSLINKNCHNSRTSDDFDMKLGLVIKTRETRQRQQKLMMTSCLQIVTSLLFFRFIANLEQFRKTDSGRLICYT